MIKYFCNKCGVEMKSPNMVITVVDGKKKTQKHYCEKCSAIIDAYINSISYGDKSAIQTKDVTDEVPTKQVDSSAVKVEKEPTQHQKFVAFAKNRDDEIIAEFNKSGLVYNPDREANRVQWFTGENLKAVQFLIDLGASCSLISRVLDIPYISVHHYFKKNNIATGTREAVADKLVLVAAEDKDITSDDSEEDFVCTPTMRAGKVSYRTEENIQKITKLLNLGFSVKEIAKTTKMPYASAYGIIQNIKRSDSDENFTEDEDGNIKKSKFKEKLVIDGTIIDVPGIVALFNAGWRVDKIASEKGYNVNTVKFALIHRKRYMEEQK